MDFRSWTTREKAGTEPQDLVELNDEIRNIIRDYHIGNIILFGENCEDTKLVTRLTYELQRTAKKAGDVPLLIGTCHIYR